MSIKFDLKKALPPFGLQNTGAICYLNSFLQVLSACTSLKDIPEETFKKSLTGTAIYNFITNPKPDSSRDVLIALVNELRQKNREVRFGRGQESASEAFVLIMDMMDTITDSDHLINNLFKSKTQ